MCRFFVIANGHASLHNLVMIAMDIFGQQFDYKGLRLASIAILDMVYIDTTRTHHFMKNREKYNLTIITCYIICFLFILYFHNNAVILSSHVFFLVQIQKKKFPSTQKFALSIFFKTNKIPLKLFNFIFFVITSF